MGLSASEGIRRRRNTRGWIEVRIQVHILFPRPKGWKIAKNVIQEITEEWIETGDLPDRCELRFCDWSINENGRLREGRAKGGDEAERIREAIIQRFYRNGAILYPPFRVLGESSDESETEPSFTR